MGTHTVHADCAKCREKDYLIYTFDTRNPISGEAFCLDCGRYYGTIEKKLAKIELAELRKEYEWGD
jgi:hypothetical protein